MTTLLVMTVPYVAFTSFVLGTSAATGMTSSAGVAGRVPLMFADGATLIKR